MAAGVLRRACGMSVPDVTSEALVACVRMVERGDRRLASRSDRCSLSPRRPWRCAVARRRRRSSTEPSTDGQVAPGGRAHGGDGSRDPDGDATTAGLGDPDAASGDGLGGALRRPASSRVHIHLGDGAFVGSYEGSPSSNTATSYVLRVRFRDSDGEIGAYAARGPSATLPPGVARRRDALDAHCSPATWSSRSPAASSCRSTSPSFPTRAPAPDDPFLYMTELYGKIKVMTRDGSGERLTRPACSISTRRGLSRDRASRG